MQGCQLASYRIFRLAMSIQDEALPPKGCPIAPLIPIHRIARLDRALQRQWNKLPGGLCLTGAGRWHGGIWSVRF